MGRRNTQRPLRSDLIDGKRDDTRAGSAGHAEIIQDGGMGVADAAGFSDKLASELIARLLLELPEHRRDLQSAYQNGNSELLERAAHKLLGAVVYCKLPQLARALRELKRTTGTVEASQTGPAFGKVIRLLDELLAGSGYCGDC
jgi:HPt (histidine-containing phosphotransfer) domain-containing protein